MIAQLRHLYDHMVNGNVSTMGIANAARGLLAPEIRALEGMQFQETNETCAITATTMRMLRSLVGANVISVTMAQHVIKEVSTGEGAASAIIRLGMVREDGRYWLDALHYMAELEAKVVSTDVEIQTGLRMLKLISRAMPQR